MSVHVLRSSQFLPIGIDQAWEYFSSPFNLSEITPPDMRFRILNGVRKEDKMFAGQVIVYRVRPLPLIDTGWVTEITHVSDKHYFIDEQRFGPYAFWHHLHRFTPVEGGVLMEDTVHYKLPFGILGGIAHRLFIRKKLEGIFNYRHNKLEQLFGKLTR